MEDRRCDAISVLCLKTHTGIAWFRYNLFSVLTTVGIERLEQIERIKEQKEQIIEQIEQIIEQITRI